MSIPPAHTQSPLLKLSGDDCDATLHTG